MLGFSDLPQGTFDQSGSNNTECQTGQKPLWLVGLKLLGVAAMVAVGAAIAVPTLLELHVPLWEAIAYTAGGMCVYTGIGYFFRPEPTLESRLIWRLHCALGPGRFAGETFLDILGVAKSDRFQPAAAEHAPTSFATTGGAGFDASRPIAPLDPNRFALSSANSVTERIMQDSQRYGANPPTAAG